MSPTDPQTRRPVAAADIALITGVTAEVAQEAARIIGVWGSLETARRTCSDTFRAPTPADTAILKYARLKDAEAEREWVADLAHQLSAIAQHKSA